ncbi:uncharacterized protein [Aegilops tauschii subsp. strangulata]|uniref:DUF6598 domain-containing protein n=2 Tax=Aegilops tauschii subsp. strangulata TaxID=200361 RepID=A0A453L251_AEGTS|nr:uncharacterized protein LOC109746533 isoform X1 [Aegilops tauschii subsp. strangulata]
MEIEMESSSVESCEPGERSVAGKISKMGGTGNAVVAMATTGKKTYEQAFLATTGKKISLQALLGTMGKKTSKQELLATTGNTSKQELLPTGKTAGSEVRKAAVLLMQVASLRGGAGDVRETRERLIGQSLEALSNAEVLASLEEEEPRRTISQEAKTDLIAYQACDQEEAAPELVVQIMSDDDDDYVKCEAAASEEACDPAFILENDTMTTMIVADPARGEIGLAEEVDVAAKSGQQKKRVNLSTEEFSALLEEEEAGRKMAHKGSTDPNAYQASAQVDDDWSDKEERHEAMELLKQNMADDDDESAKFEAAAPEEATGDEIRISEEAAEVAAEEEMMMMGFGGLAEEAAEEAAESWEQKRKRRGDLSIDEMMARTREMVGEVPEEANTDHNAYCARVYREDWDWLFAPLYGPFDKTTSIPPSCCSHHHRNSLVRPQQTLQIFSIKVGKIKKPLMWPLHVFGSVAVRDKVDHNRIMVFHRQRENCQTLTKKDRSLMLTGPTRGVVVDVHPTYIEVDLKFKGTTESEDMDLSYLVVASSPGGPSYRAEASKRSTLELTYVRMYDSVEAAISVKLKKDGSWPGCRGLFTASTASLEDMEILLLAFKGDRLPVNGKGRIEFSRRVVSVELRGKLIFSAKALQGSDEKGVRRVRKTFTPKRAGKSKENIKIGSCEMEVTVTWSLLPSCKFDYDNSL